MRGHITLGTHLVSMRIHDFKLLFQTQNLHGTNYLYRWLPNKHFQSKKYLQHNCLFYVSMECQQCRLQKMQLQSRFDRFERLYIFSRKKLQKNLSGKNTSCHQLRHFTRVFMLLKYKCVLFYDHMLLVVMTSVCIAYTFSYTTVM